MEALLLIAVGILIIVLLGSSARNRQMETLEAENQVYRTLLTTMARQNDQVDSGGCLVSFVLAVVLVVIVLIVLVG